MGFSTAGKNAMLNHLASLAIYASLHTGDPGDAGSNEVSGGSPAYARKSSTWNSASSGSLDNSNQPVFDVPAGTTVTYAGFWSALTTGTFYGSGSITSETFGGQGTYTLTDADLSIT